MIKSNENYGVFIDGLEIEGKPAPYGVVNENAIRASAGLMFALAFFTMIYTYLTKDFLVVKIVVPLLYLSFYWFLLARTQVHLPLLVTGYLAGAHRNM